jgi:hypothetical protein
VKQSKLITDMFSTMLSHFVLLHSAFLSQRENVRTLLQVSVAFSCVKG